MRTSKRYKNSPTFTYNNYCNFKFHCCKKATREDTPEVWPNKGWAARACHYQRRDNDVWVLLEGEGPGCAGL